MLKRTITAVILFLILVPELFFSGTISFPITIGICIVISLYEMFRCLGVHKKLVLTIPYYLIGAGAPFAVRYMKFSYLNIESFHGTFTDVALVLVFFIMLYMLAVVVFSLNTMSFNEVAGVFMSALYIIFSFCGIIYLRDISENYIYLFVFAGAWITDIFAYLVGRLIGKHKLIPEISPHKTIEGSIGGIVFCTIAFVVLPFAFKQIFKLDFDIEVWQLVIAGIFSSIAAQIGDLSMSAIKRYYGIKDYGKIFPGHGGMLDRFDSILAVSAVMTVLCAVSMII